MKIAILSVAKQSYSTQHIHDAAMKRGHHVIVMNTLKCHLHFASQTPSIYYEGQIAPALDLIIPRIGASITFYGTTILRQFELMGIHTLNTADAINCARNKLHSLQLLSQYSIPLPTSAFAHEINDYEHLLPKLGNPPYLLKPLIGTQGKGIEMCQDNFAAHAAIAQAQARKKRFLMQQFLSNDEISDIRCFVIGKKVVASIKRHAKPDEFRANLHCGGTASAINLTSYETKLALQAADILGLTIAGVDMLRTPNGPVILEVNASPGLEGIECATGIDIATEIIKYAESSLNQVSFQSCHTLHAVACT